MTSNIKYLANFFKWISWDSRAPCNTISEFRFHCFLGILNLLKKLIRKTFRVLEISLTIFSFIIYAKVSSLTLSISQCFTLIVSSFYSHYRSEQKEHHKKIKVLTKHKMAQRTIFFPVFNETWRKYNHSRLNKDPAKKSNKLVTFSFNSRKCETFF